MKKRNWMIVAALIAVGAVSLFSVGQASALTTLKLGHVGPPGSYLDLAAQKLKENMETLSKGDLTLQIFPGGQLGNLPQMLGQVKKGSLDLWKTDYVVIMIAKEAKAFVVGTAPYLFRDQAHLEKFIASPIFAEMKDVVEKENGIKWVGLLGDRSPRALTTRNKMVVVPEDLKGLKIRVPQTPGIPDAFKAWGASIGVVSAPEMYNALKQKVIDGQDNGIEIVATFKLWEIQEQYTAIDHVRSAEAIWMNAEKWNSLTPEQQKVMVEATRLTRLWGNQYIKEMSEGWFDEARARGMTIVMPPLKPWIESSRKVIEELDGKAWPKGLYDRIKNLQ